MKEQKIAKVYISDINEPYNYESVKNIIDEILEEKLSGRKIVILCSEKNGYVSIGERYAVDRGIDIEYLPEFWFGFLKVSDPMKMRKIAKLSDFMLLFKGDDVSDLATLFEYAVKYCTPLQARDIV